MSGCYVTFASDFIALHILLFLFSPFVFISRSYLFTSFFFSSVLFSSHLVIWLHLCRLHLPKRRFMHIVVFCNPMCLVRPDREDLSVAPRAAECFVRWIRTS